MNKKLMILFLVFIVLNTVRYALAASSEAPETYEVVMLGVNLIALALCVTAIIKSGNK